MVQANGLIIVIGGATAVGKSEIALNLAQKYNGEIVSADSMQIYKGLDIGTAKPSKQEQVLVKHHLIDIVEPNAEFSVEDFKELADKAIENILSRGKLPVVVGGTGFYIKNLLYALPTASGKSDEIRKKYNTLVNEGKGADLHKRLQEIDPASADVIHPNDYKRVIRALEIYETTGKARSQFQSSQEPRYNFKMFVIDRDRAKLYERINKRVDVMIEQGLIGEVRTLLENGLITQNSQSMQAIGYKEVVSYLKGNITLNDTIELIKKNTRNYAKRQITFFKSIKEAKWCDFEHAMSDIVL